MERHHRRRTVGQRQAAGLPRHLRELHSLWQRDGQGDERTVAVHLAEPGAGIGEAHGRAQVLLGKGRLFRDVEEPKERALLLGARLPARSRVALEEPWQARAAYGVLSRLVQAELLKEADPLLGPWEEASPGVAFQVEGDSEELAVVQGPHEMAEAAVQFGGCHDPRGDGLEASLEVVALPVVADCPVKRLAVECGPDLSEGESVLLAQRPCAHVRASE